MIMSNIAQSNMESYTDNCRHGSYNSYNQQNPHPMFNKSGSGRPGAGFTLLQGHIQLMAMVPNLPENQTSPRWKGYSPNNTSNQNVYESVQSSNEENASFPITPRMMPSASKYKRPHLPAVMAGKAAQSGYSSCLPPIWQAPRSLSNSSLPPKNSEPITMPSFAKILPGTKRAMASSSNYCGGDNVKNQFQPLSSSFPLIPNQPTFQTVATHNVDLSNKQEMFIHQHQPQIMEQQQMQIPTATQMNPTYLNHYTNQAATMYPPQMAYQMINMRPSQYQTTQQQQYYLGGSGDNNAMASAMHQIHLQQQHQQSFEQTALAYPFQQQHQQYPQQIFQTTDMFQYSPQAPYAVQSMPCFGTPCTSSNGNACGVPNFHMSSSVNDKTGYDVIHQSLPESPQPVYSASMPEICLGAQNPQHCNSHPAQMRKSKKSLPKSTNSNGKKEVSIVVEDSSSASSSSSSEDENESRKDKSNSMAVLKLREIQKVKEEKKSKDDEKYAVLGPESTPDKIPTKQRLAHTPIRIKPPTEEPHFEVKFEEKEAKCSRDKDSCTNCNCCQKKVKDVEPNDKQQPQALDEKVRELKNKLTPRKKGKPVVVAVHDIFPSDSSMSEPESDLDSARKSCFNYVGNNGSMVRKRKPRMESILKSKLKGDSSEVFDDLENDLNPDEARTYTGDYLVELLTSDDWNNCYTALQIMVRLARHRPKVLLNHLNGPILWYTFKHITSPKSALCRAAIVTFKELFQSIGSALDNELDKITEKLVLKSLAPNMFIREECDRALEAMVGHCNLVKVLNAMDIVSKKPHSRAAGHRLAKMALQIVQVAGVDVCLKPVYAEKLLPMLFSYMTEANNGTRTAAKEALALLMNHLQFETAVTKHVTFDKNCTEVFKKLDKMRGRNRNRRQVGNARYPLPHAHFRR